jgi:hypothetical protein
MMPARRLMMPARRRVPRLVRLVIMDDISRLVIDSSPSASIAMPVGTLRYQHTEATMNSTLSLTSTLREKAGRVLTAATREVPMCVVRRH